MGFSFITTREEGCDEVSLLFLICNLNLNCSFGNNGGEGEVKVGEVNNGEVGKGVTDNESKISDEFKNDSSISEIGKSLNVVEGDVGIKGIVKEEVDVS